MTITRATVRTAAALTLAAGTLTLAGPAQAATPCKDIVSPDTTAVVLATGAAPYDALTAGPLASALGAPIVLTEGAHLHHSAADTITQWQPDVVVIVGGPAAVPSSVQDDFSAKGQCTYRLSGDTRYSTAEDVAAMLKHILA